MKKVILLGLAALLISNAAVASQYFYRYPILGVISKNKNSGGELNNPDTEENKNAWVKYADDNNISHTENFDIFGVDVKNQTLSSGIPNFPNAKYPASNPKALNLDGNFSSLLSFSSLKSPDIIVLSSPNITNLNGFSNISSINTLQINATKLTDLSGLSNIKSTHPATFLGNNFSPHIDIYSSGEIYNPINSDSWLCQSEQSNLFSNGMNQEKACGVLEPWAAFAKENNLNYETVPNKPWLLIDWSQSNLSQIPSEPYPILYASDNVGEINLSNNNLENVEGLSSVKSVVPFGSGGSGVLDLSNNNLSNIEGLRNLNTTFELNLNNNNLVNLNGLQNLELARYILLNNNPLDNLSGLNNLKNANNFLSITNSNIKNIGDLEQLKSVGVLNISKNANLVDISGLNTIEQISVLYIDKGIQNREGYIGPSDSSWICQPENSSVFSDNVDSQDYANQDEICD